MTAQIKFNEIFLHIVSHLKLFFMCLLLLSFTLFFILLLYYCAHLLPFPNIPLQLFLTFSMLKERLLTENNLLITSSY